MPVVGSLHGRGYLVGECGRREAADYALNILDDNGSAVAKGALVSAVDLVAACWGREDTRLQLADGRTLRICIAGLPPRDGHALFCSVGDLSAEVRTPARGGEDTA